MTGPGGSGNPDAATGMVFVGVGGVGTFNHTGGTNSCSTLFIGSLNNILSLDLHTGDWNGGGQGTYNLSNGLVVADEEDMAQYGQAGFATVPTGIFNQTGGTNTINARLVMGDDTMGGTAQATYNLAGGLLRLPQMQLNGGNNSTINFSGGTLQAIPGTYHNTSLDIAVPVVVGTAASNVATFDANDMTINLNAYGALTGPGQLRVIDSAGGGTVILGGGGIITPTAAAPRSCPARGSAQQPGPAGHGRFDRRWRGVDCVELARGDALREQQRGTGRDRWKRGRGDRKFRPRGRRRRRESRRGDRHGRGCRGREPDGGSRAFGVGPLGSWIDESAHARPAASEGPVQSRRRKHQGLQPLVVSFEA